MAVDESNNHDEMVDTSSPKEFTTNAVLPEGCFNVGSYGLWIVSHICYTNLFCSRFMADNATDDVGIVETSTGKEFTPNGLEAEGRSNVEPYVGMEFESEEAAKAYYSTYATHLGFIMRVDAFRRSMRNGELVWRRLVCNKEGFSKSRQSQNGKKKCRAIREGCKAMIIVKKEQSGKWLVAKLVKEHNHALVVKPVNTPKGAVLCQTPVSTSS
ncbi:hypothetical protein MTR67_039979 [Solanum verrucosum]|uniref:FAR1 domain-containing protein n=1 Tax=Solanum verrucosum TaxID=315347 RepID=A0AAF0ZRP7_SOLVR|nr:hypothetical protein MTR67_039979 [Solanum verrucosum]